MENNKYTIKYSSTFINQFNNILKYFVHKLKNKIAAENFYNEVIKEIETRSKNPENYEKYLSTRKRKNSYYRIYVKNYIIFYIVKDTTMEIRRILYSKRNFDKLI
ncbi:MAG: type II toxin-antitoxin system RelE/ParE family toxin [Clostridia bacterium]|nr:type II toxin-antitoxin system RelE/ParE family toxin [Clostridia bacterium]